MDALEDFIIRAKAATYAGGGAPAASCRPASHDLVFCDGGFRYLDSYFGGTDFSGQEVVWRDGEPVWAMGYHGRVLRDDLITGTEAGATVKAALTALYGNTWLGNAAAAGAAAMSGGALTAFELLCDNALMDYIRAAKLRSFGAAHVSAYLAAMENETTAARMILTGRLAGLQPAVIRERLRETYA